MLQVKGWHLIRSETDLLHEFLEADDALNRHDADNLASKIMQKFADLAEKEQSANTGVTIPKLGTRCRGPFITWQSILRDKQAKEPSACAAARWGVQVAREVVNYADQPSSDEGRSLKIGYDEALGDARDDDDDLVALLRGLRDLIDDAPGLELKQSSSEEKSCW